MKIAKIEPLHVGQFMYACIETDEGIVGWGEAGIWGHIQAAGQAIERFAEYLVGKRAFDIEHHWNVMHRFSYFQGLAINSAISAIDIAGTVNLSAEDRGGWDAAGPMWQLPCR